MSAINISSTIVLALVEAIRHARVPTYIELICLVLGFFGAILIAAPDVIEKLVRFVFCCDYSCCKKEANVTTEE